VIKQVLHKISSMTLALLMLVSTVSFTIEKHYCGDILVDIALFSQVQKCGMESTENEMPTITKKMCCKDTIDLLQGQDELNLITFNNLDFDQQVFITTYAYSYVSLFQSLPKQVIPHKDYSPPNLISDIQVLDQVFII